MNAHNGAIGGRDLLDPQLLKEEDKHHIFNLAFDPIASSSWMGLNKCFWNFELLHFMHSTNFFPCVIIESNYCWRDKKQEE